MPKFLNGLKKVGAPFYVGEGTNTRSWVHIEDLVTVYLKLVEAAVSGGGNANWGKTVLYIPFNCKTYRCLNYTYKW